MASRKLYTDLDLSGNKLLNVPGVTDVNGVFIGGNAYTGKALMIYDGNSLWQGTGSSHQTSSTTDFTPGPFPSQTQSVLVAQFPNATFTAYNFGVGGQTTAQMLSDVVTQVDALYDPVTYDRQVVICGEITNQLANGSGFTAQQAIDNYVQYCKGRRAKGFLVVATTVLPRTSLFTNISAADFETARTTVNNYLRANYLQFADVLADIASVSGVTYPDGTHPNDAGYILIGNYVATKVAPLLVTGFNPQSIAPLLSASAVTTPVSATTPVVFLKGQGANGSTTITDDGTPPHTFTALNTARISTAQFKYGSSSLYFDGGVNTYFNTPSSTDFDFGTGDFTMEGWLYKTNAGTGFPPVFTRGDNVGNQWTLCFPNAGARLEFYVSTSSTNYVAQGLNTTTDFPLNQWVHVALVRASGSTKLYQNGVLVGTATSNANLESNPTGRSLKIGFLPAFGSDATAGDRFNGYMQYVKFTKSALYTAAFTPSDPTQQSTASTLQQTSGTSVQSGNGTTTAFTIAHGLGTTPGYISVMAGSDAADMTNIKKAVPDATNITVTFKVAPFSGTNNLTLYWQARR